MICLDFYPCDPWDLVYLARCFRSSANGRTSNFIASEVGKRIGFKYDFPLTNQQFIEVMLTFQAQMPELVEWARKHPREGGLLFRIEDMA